VSQLQEICAACGWKFNFRFEYHGGVPVEHPICPSCGGDITWNYTFDADEVEGEPEAMASLILPDEAAFPEDNSPAYLEMGELLDARLIGIGGPFRVSNVDGVVDVELRPYVHPRSGNTGVKLIANVGRSTYSVALLELLSFINARLFHGAVIAHTSAYGLPDGGVELFAFGTEVSLFFQDVIDEETVGSEAWAERIQSDRQIAADLARQLRSAALASRDPAARSALPGLDLPTDELSSSNFGRMALEQVQGSFMEELFAPEPNVDELTDRVKTFLGELSLAAVQDNGVFRFCLDSARITVQFIERSGRTLLRFHSVLVAGIRPDALEGGEQVVAGVLTTLNAEIISGRCLIEADGDTLRISFEKTILGADLDLSEFAINLAMVGEEADRLDNLLQEAFGGLRADQTESTETFTDLAPLLGRLAAEVPGIEKAELARARTWVRHMLEELHLPMREDSQGDFWFSFGSARFAIRVWQDARATYLTLRARVLHDLDETDGLAQALNDINAQIHFGAFALRDGSVEFVETILADDLSVEELAYALVTVGELADNHDDPLQERFGGFLAEQLDS
jgi:hypothetical protein